MPRSPPEARRQDSRRPGLPNRGRSQSPRVASTQNPYRLLNRTFEIGLAEVAIREPCGLLADSPLGFGMLSGKYLDGHRPPGARLTLFEGFGRRSNPESEEATAENVALAQRRGLDPAQLALACATSRPFTTKSIIGATTWSSSMPISGARSSPYRTS
jgi:aryl-alcohol dehydrogenase-like predicted oxidoreductase